MNLQLKGRIVARFGSQRVFALILKTREPEVSRVVNGRKGLSEKEQREWAALLECKVRDVFPQDEQQEARA